MVALCPAVTWSEPSRVLSDPLCHPPQPSPHPPRPPMTNALFRSRLIWSVASEMTWTLSHPRFVFPSRIGWPIYPSTHLMPSTIEIQGVAVPGRRHLPSMSRPSFLARSLAQPAVTRLARLFYHARPAPLEAFGCLSHGPNLAPHLMPCRT
ncbi:hypothetical protein LY76DRAFT_164305 [Colletotrichum caudatum]|nr:hypothetical protein LY76DRAFT_164305 [Colletotrichum caudatum]